MTIGTGIHRSRHGKTKDGHTVERILLQNGRGMRVGILTYGGIIEEISVPDRDGRPVNVALTLRDLPAYEAAPNFGSLVGRYANRISRGGFILDGQYHSLSPDMSAIVLHGGEPGFGSRVWRIVRQWADGDSAAITLEYISPDGENGFPGELCVQVTYALTADNSLALEYVANTSAPTVVNLTHHVYFNLGGADCGSIDAHHVQIFADRYAPIDALQNANGEIEDVAGALDLRRGARIGSRITLDDPQLALANGFNQSFVVNRSSPHEMALAARLWEPLSGLRMEVRTTEPAVQFYTANEFDGSLPGAGGRRLRQGAGCALETQHHPDSPNHPHFPSTVLRPGQRFESRTSFTFSHCAWLEWQDQDAPNRLP